MLDPINLYVTSAGHPPQSNLTRSPAKFTTSFAIIPKGVIRDIVTSGLPFWNKYKCWVLARPLSGFSETFSYYLMELLPKGGSKHPESDSDIESIIFVTCGSVTLSIDSTIHILNAGGYAYIPSGINWTLKNDDSDVSQIHWIRKRYLPVDGIQHPAPFVTSIADRVPESMPGTNGRWSTIRFVDPQDMSHDMHVNIVSFEPGASIPFPETHVMEHGIFILEGKGLYLLNDEWIEVEAGDFLWLRAFCPQACYAGGETPFRYLLYKDVNRHVRF